MNYRNKFYTALVMAFALVVGAFSVRTIVLEAKTITSTVVASNSTPVIQQVADQVANAAVPQASAAVTPVVIDNPSHLIIPNAHVDASIIPVGVTNTNNLDVPPNFVQVGWYKLGPKPGEIGNTVLDGHVDNGGSIDGVFKHLRDLKSGDDIYVTGADGKQLHYKVDHSDVYLTTQFPSDLVFNQNNGQPILRIITCHGTYVPSVGTYDHRLVVTATLVQ